MRRYALVGVMVVLAAGIMWAADTGGKTGAGKTDTKTTETPKAQPKSGDVQGSVTGVDAARGEQGWVFTVKLRTTEGNSVTLYARPRNGQAYSAAGELKAGDKVRVAWMSEAGTDKKWITSISTVRAETKDTTTKKPTSGSK